MGILKKITDKKILYIFTLCVLVFLPILKQASFYLSVYGVIKNYDSINPAIILYFSVPFFIYVYIKNLIKTKRELDIYDYLFYMLIFAGIVAVIFSIDKEIALFGKPFRHEGFFSVLCYYLLFITWKVSANEKDIKILIKVILGMAILNSVYALGQIYTPFRFILRFGVDTEMASGLCGNPNFFGSLIVTALGIVTPKLLIEKKKNILQFIILILLFISLINSQSAGPFLTYIITLLFFIVYLIIKKKLIIKKVIVLICVLLLTYISVYFINNNSFGVTRCEMCNVMESISDSDNHTDISSGRFEIWQKSLKVAKDNLINGVGFDNLHLAYYKDVNLTEVTFYSSGGQIHAVKKYNKIVDNAHNIYLHTLISTGLVGLIPYLILCLYTFIRGLKTKNNLMIFLLGGFVAYSIQGFLNLNVLQVAPIYYVIIGLMLSIKE